MNNKEAGKQTILIDDILNLFKSDTENLQSEIQYTKQNIIDINKNDYP